MNESSIAERAAEELEAGALSLPTLAAQAIEPKLLEKQILAGVSSRIEGGDFSKEDVHFVSKLALPAASGSLESSNEMLERLRRAAQVWDVELKQKSFSSHRPVVGPIIVGVKKALFPIIRFFMADSLRQQRDFNAAVLRCLVELTRENNSKETQQD